MRRSKQKVSAGARGAGKLNLIRGRESAEIIKIFAFNNRYLEYKFRVTFREIKTSAVDPSLETTNLEEFASNGPKKMFPTNDAGSEIKNSELIKFRRGLIRIKFEFFFDP